jgi:two-component system, LytTR family, response regulator LytT
MISTLIIEDEERAASRLEMLLKRLDPEIEILSIIDTVSSAVKWIENHPQPDLIMLDIQLGDGLSFDIFRKTRVDSYVIFTTAYDEYAIKAFEVNSIDYLMKPVDEIKLSNSLRKYRQFHEAAQKINLEKLLETLENRTDKFKKRFVVSIANKIRIVDTSSTAFFYSKDKNTFLCSMDNHHYPLDFSLDQIEHMLNPELFFRVNRQFIISFQSIARIDILSKSRIKIETNPKAETEILVSSARTSDFRMWLDK